MHTIHLWAELLCSLSAEEDRVRRREIKMSDFSLSLTLPLAFALFLVLNGGIYVSRNGLGVGGPMVSVLGFGLS